MQVNLIGLDVECRASFSGQPVRAAIIQIANKEDVFIIDMLSLREVEKIDASQSQILIKSIFANPNVLKLGFSMKEDLVSISRALPGLEHLSKQVTKMVDLHPLWTSIQSQHPTFFKASGKMEHDLTLIWIFNFYFLISWWRGDWKRIKRIGAPVLGLPLGQT